MAEIKSLQFTDGVSVTPPSDASNYFVLNNFSATVNPTTTDDSSLDYAIGSHWVNTVSDEIFVCVDATATSAIWKSTTAAALLNTQSKTGAYTVLSTDGIVICDATSAGFTITLFTAVGNTGKEIIITKKDSSDNVVTIDGSGSETIDGTTTIDLDRQHQSVRFLSDGTNWVTTHGRHQIDSMVRLHTGNGYGSSNTRIRRFTTTVDNIGSAITLADSSTLGATFTINEDGVYYVTFGDTSSTGAINVGISLNSSQLTTNIELITVADRLTSTTSGGSTFEVIASWAGVLSQDDVIRAHGDSFADGTANTNFTITKLGRL